MLGDSEILSVMLYIIGIYTRRCVKRLADFISGGRMAGRHIGILNFGIIPASISRCFGHP